MKTIIQHILFGLLLSCSYSFAISQPVSNDECVGAIAVATNPFALTCTSPTAATTLNASPSAPAPSCASTLIANDDIWYTFTANSASIIVRVSDAVFVSSGTATISMGIYNGSCGNLSSVTCINAFAFGSGFRIINGLTIGNIYFVRFWTTSTTNAATFNFCIQDVPSAPANDECTNAISIVTQPFGINCSSSLTANTNGATRSSPDPSCTNTDNNDDIWYTFTANSQSVVLRFNNLIETTDGSSGSLGYALYSTACPTTTSTISCSNNVGFGSGFRIIDGLTIGNTYLLRLYGLGFNNYISFSFCIQDLPAPPVNDECAGAIPIVIQPFGTNCNEFVSVNTTGATHSLPDPPCGVIDSNDDLWYRFVANSNSVIFRFSDALLTTSTGAATVGFTLYEGNCPVGNSALICNTNAGFSNGTQIISGLTIGNTYQLRLFSQGANNYMTVRFCIQQVPPPPINDDCQNAIPVSLSLPGSNCISSVLVNTTGSTPSANPASCILANSNNDDLWYSFVASANTAVLRYNNCTETTSSNSASIGYAIYNSCPSNSTALTCVDRFGFRDGFSNITGLTPGNSYLIRLFSANPNNYVSFGFCIQSPLQNDDCNNAISIPVTNGFCTSPIMSSLNGATTSVGFGAPSCVLGSSTKDVWFTITIPATGNVIIQTSAVKPAANDVVMTAFTGNCNALSEIACDDNGNPELFPSQDHSRITLTGRSAGETIYIRVCPKTSSSEEQFVICAWDESVTVLPAIAPSGNCDPGLLVSIDSSNANLYRWVPIFNNNQQIIAEIYSNGNELGLVTSKLFVNPGSIRQFNNQYYLDRNISITSNATLQLPVSLRLYLTQPELSALMNVEPAISGRGSLKLIRTNTECEAAISGSTTSILQQSNAPYGNNHLLQFSTNSFSGFYIDGLSGSLPLRFIEFSAKATIRTVSLEWKVEKDPELLFFEVQRSINGVDFESKDTILYSSFSGESANARTYTWTYEQNLDFDAYYRIKMVGANNQNVFSKVELVRKKNSPFPSATIVPNPAKDIIYVEIAGVSNEKLLIELTDLQGRKLFERRELNSSNRISIDIQKIPSGLYILQIHSPTRSITTKFIKQ